MRLVNPYRFAVDGPPPGNNPLNEGLLCHLKLDESSPDQRIDTVNNIAFTNINDPARVDGVIDGAMQAVQGSPDRAIYGDYDSRWDNTGDLTLCCWANMSLSQWQPVLCMLDAAGHRRWGWFLRRQNNRWWYTLDGVSYRNEDVGFTNTANVWQMHSAVYREATNEVQFRNVSLDIESTAQLDGSMFQGGQPDFEVGVWQAGNDFSDGAYDEVHYYNRALTDQELDDLEAYHLAGQSYPYPDV